MNNLNEIMIKNEVQVEAGKISFDGIEQFKENVASVDKYIKSIDIENAEEKEIVDTKSSLDNLLKQLDTEFKRIRNVYVEPFEKFKKEYDLIVSTLKNSQSSLLDKKREIKNFKEKTRSSIVEGYIRENIKDHDLDIELFKDLIHEMRLGKYFKSKSYELKASSYDIINTEILNVFDKEQEYKAKIRIIENNCKAKGLVSLAYTENFTRESKITDTLKKIDRDFEYKNKHEQEVKAPKVDKSRYAVLDKETGEIVEQESTYRFKLSIQTDKTKSKLLEEFMIDNKIDYEIKDLEVL